MKAGEGGKCMTGFLTPPSFIPFRGLKTCHLLDRPLQGQRQSSPNLCSGGRQQNRMLTTSQSVLPGLQPWQSKCTRCWISVVVRPPQSKRLSQGLATSPPRLARGGLGIYAQLQNFQFPPVLYRLQNLESRRAEAETLNRNPKP